MREGGTYICFCPLKSSFQSLKFASYETNWATRTGLNVEGTGCVLQTLFFLFLHNTFWSQIVNSIMTSS